MRVVILVMGTEIIKPKKEKNKDVEKKSVFTPVIYLLLGMVLAFKSNEAVTLMFYLLGILIIVYGIKSFLDYRRYRELAQFKKINLGVAVTSIIIGVLMMVLAEAIQVGIRYVLGFFLIFFGVTRLLNQFSFGYYVNFNLLVNITLIILGVFSIFVSNAILVVAGWILMANALILFWEYFKS